MKRHIIMVLVYLGFSTLPLTRNSKQLDPENFVTYQASHGGSSWHGRAPIDEMVLEPNGDWLELTLLVNPAHFDSGNLMRDGLASATVFESKTYPFVTFTTSIKPSVLNDDIQQLKVQGVLTMHGMAKEIIVLVNLERDGSRLTATGTFEVKLSDFHMTRPRVAGFLVNDDVTVYFNVGLELLPKGLSGTTPNPHHLLGITASVENVDNACGSLGHGVPHATATGLLLSEEG